MQALTTAVPPLGVVNVMLLHAGNGAAQSEAVLHPCEHFAFAPLPTENRHLQPVAGSGGSPKPAPPDIARQE